MTDRGAAPGRGLVEYGLVLLLALATLGEGGASVVGLTVWHGLLVLVWLFALLRSGPVTHRLRPGVVTLAFGLFLFLAAVGAVRAPYRYAALLTLLELIAFSGWVLIAASRGGDWLRRAVPALSLVAAGQTLWILVQRFGMGEPRGAGTFLNPNHAGAWFAAVTLLALATWGRASDSSGRLLRLGFCAPPMLGLLLTGSKGALLGFFVGLAVWIPQGWRRLSPVARRAAVVAGLILLAIGATVIVRRQQEDDPFRFHRLEIWSATGSMIAAEPLWGSGPGQYGLAAGRHQFDDGVGPLRYDRRFRSAHSDPLQLAAEFGLPATLAWAVVIAGLSLTLFRRRRISPGSDGELAWLLPPLAGIVVQALVDTPSHWPSVYLLAGALVGAACAAPRSDPHLRSPASARAVLAAGLAGLFLIADLGPTAAHRMFVATDGQQAHRDARLEAILRLDPLRPGPQMERATRAADGAAEPLASYIVAREAAETAIRLSSGDARWHWGLARIEGRACLDLLGDEATRRRARAAFERASSLEPTDPRILLDGAEFLLDSGDAGTAVAWSRRAVELEPNSPVARLHLAEALLASNEGLSEAARDEYRAAMALRERFGSHERDNRYSAELMGPDPARVERVARRLGELHPPSTTFPVAEP